MSYSVKEAFYSLQGEGARTGRAAVFCRFAGCNLWSGREQDRGTAVCDFCDTDFRGTDGDGGGRFDTAQGLAAHLLHLWRGQPDERASPYVIFTGGEPLLQLDAALLAVLHDHDVEIAVETNGTLPVPDGVDWICVSPKADAGLVQTRGDELKLVYPQPLAPPERFAGLAFRHFFLQPRDDTQRAAHTAAAVAYCKAHPRWRLSLQTHKLIGIP
ncbi:7-carboxy-7-deazaguanine synthase [Thiohalocapsa marina]|uniref:7-carboxy-7-deazaguanine synthase n=1 Tax=Thiohalocapsa marina TaxID=424902 RepID=A0A5M8FT68_9GAMM|nr:7-carboxy-7-deazaguanine synthase [Thiohalocapsa marina]KAA6186993.1 7-carboxy-7-deazaguanine synthase [Thiohalocapsa marina]